MTLFWWSLIPSTNVITNVRFTGCKIEKASYHASIQRVINVGAQIVLRLFIVSTYKGVTIGGCIHDKFFNYISCIFWWLIKILLGIYLIWSPRKYVSSPTRLINSVLIWHIKSCTGFFDLHKNNIINIYLCNNDFSLVSTNK